MRHVTRGVGNDRMNGLAEGASSTLGGGVALFALLAATALPATALADTASEIRALKARLLKLETQAVKERQEAKEKHAKEATSHQHASGHDSSSGSAPAPKHWYERISLRGYTQLRWNDVLDAGPVYNDVVNPADRSVGGRNNFLIRRARLVFSGDITDHLSIYIQPDLASSPNSSFSSSPTLANTALYGAYNPGLFGTYSNNGGGYFAQLRDAYADIYFDDDKEFRVRVGQSKIPFGFENMQSSQNRLALDRNDAINSCCKDERDLGMFFYYTPKELRPLFRDLVKNNLKGSGDYGMLAFGVYNGQGANRVELNENLHIVARATYPYVFENGQIVEVSVQGYTGRFVPFTSAITPSLYGASFLAGYRPDGSPPAGIPVVNAPGYGSGTYTLGTYTSSSATQIAQAVNGGQGVRDQRVAVSGILYPQPFGLQAEWNWGRGPVLDSTQTSISAGSLNGGYVQATYKYVDTELGTGTWFPFVKYQYFKGGQKFENNAPLSRLYEWDFGVEWQPVPELELVAVYTKTDRTNVLAAPYRQFHANLLRMQLQWNY
jgi:hypothetical protein